MKATDEQNLELRHLNPTDILDGLDVVAGEVDGLEIVEGDVLNVAEEFRLFIFVCIIFIFTSM